MLKHIIHIYENYPELIAKLRRQKNKNKQLHDWGCEEARLIDEDYHNNTDRFH